jgi:hypothetical protein
MRINTAKSGANALNNVNLGKKGKAAAELGLPEGDPPATAHGTPES